MKVGVHFSRFMTILSHFCFIIFDMTHKRSLLFRGKLKIEERNVFLKDVGIHTT